MPKLVSDDIPLLHSLLSDVFPGVRYTRAEMGALRKEIARVCSEMHLVAGETGQQWVEKVRVNCSSFVVQQWGMAVVSDHALRKYFGKWSCSGREGYIAFLDHLPNIVGIATA